MSKYIDKDKVLEYIIFGVVGKDITCGELTRAIESIPTIEVSEDCISREDAIKAYNEAIDELVKAEMEEFNLGDFTECSFNTTQLKLIARKIENAPSVVPRLDKEDLEDIYEHISESYVEGYMDGQAEGEWIEHKRVEEYDGLLKPNYECSQCHDWLREQTNYCPTCGAKMKGKTNE